VQFGFTKGLHTCCSYCDCLKTDLLHEGKACKEIQYYFNDYLKLWVDDVNKALHYVKWPVDDVNSKK